MSGASGTSVTTAKSGRPSAFKSAAVTANLTNGRGTWAEGSCDPEGFFRLAHTYDDELKWCGTTPIYTFLRAAPEARGQILHYGQWNIDEQSVVTYAGLEFLGR